MMPSRKRRRIYAGTILLVLLGLASRAIGWAAQEKAPAQQQTSNSTKNADFGSAADEVLEQMSEITDLKLLTPLKKSLRSRDEIRAYVIAEMNDEKDADERYAGQRSAEAFGLLPKSFDLDHFMVELLTEQIAGLYDAKAHEFYVADWIPLADQRMVMAHELTHALEDQHFHIEGWVKAARPNDDAELARESVLEGSAMAAMVEYLLQGSGRSLKDLPDIDPSMLVGDMSDTPNLKKAPPFIKDVLIFPYLGGLTFSAAILKPAGWSALPGVFAKPPASTQQILHPELYLSGKVPGAVSLPDMGKALGPDWRKLDENTMGEFGWREILKQFLGDDASQRLSSAWDGDRYELYEQKQSKRLVLITHEVLQTSEQAGQFFQGYSDALHKKYGQQTNITRRDEFLSFDTPDGAVFFRCVDKDCITLEGANRAVFVSLNKSLNWSVVPAQDKEE